MLEGLTGRVRETTNQRREGGRGCLTEGTGVIRVRETKEGRRDKTGKDYRERLCDSQNGGNVPFSWCCCCRCSWLLLFFPLTCWLISFPIFAHGRHLAIVNTVTIV